MTDPLALEPILGPLERRRPAFNDDLSHDQRFALFEGHVTGGGKGGRNQEFALAAAALLAEHGGMSVIASVGTDGIDGPTDAAGAIADGQTIERARRAGLATPRSYLDDNNSHAFFESLGDLIHTGPTGTNVGDLQVFLLA